MSRFDFNQVMESVTGGEGAYSANVTLNWLQGRATFGGLVVALGVRATALERNAEKAPLRSILVSFVGPLAAGECQISVRCLRQGKSVSQYAAEITQNSQCIGMMNLVYGVGREEKRLPIPTQEKLPNKERIPTFAKNAAMPAFLGNFEIKWVGNGLPMSGSNDQRLNAWVALSGVKKDFALERMIAVADVPPPVMMSHYNVPIPSSSVTWKLEIIAAPEEMISNDWFYLDYELEIAADGYSQQSGRVYDEAGKLALLGHQCMVYFGPKD